ncbi:hypothetical protein SAMN05660284_02618 [Formivibrio citricus]|uniref:Uncharacterized protein n=1 Tax=Formivibrio citricus TaxID=83765 RepID=A0A1I5DBR8_9NEIS|nr:hypothetical protein [Formivibrio citricus]SFN96653.1 hypothetical protein SAMN05660284_02618 [Formivibrio citricus]
MNYSVFEYLYRDAGNYKAWGALLLEGETTEAEMARIRRHLLDNEFFIAEQIGVPVLYEQLWQQCQSEPSEELDHVWHEFCRIREATAEDRIQLPTFGTTAALVAAFEAVGKWDWALSRNYEL